jgi:hypothetical protein
VDAQRAHVDKILAQQASRNPDLDSPKSAAEVVVSMEKLTATEPTWQAEIGELLRASTIEKSLSEP